MFKKLVTAALMVLAVNGLYAQSYQDLVESIGPEDSMLEGDTEGWMLGGMMGLLVEENATTGETDVYAQIGIQPEFGIGKFGIGLDLTLNYNISTNEMKQTDFDENEDYINLIRYIRYGRFPYADGVYLKAGAIDNATIGHGFIINRYKTDVDYDNRQAGAQFNLNYNYWGLETFTNNAFLGEVMGARVVIRPMASNPLPIISDIGFGISMAIDQTAPHILTDDETYDVDNESWSAPGDGLPDWDDEENFIIDSDEAISIYGLDAEAPVVRWDWLAMNLYLDYAQMKNVGTDTGTFSDGMAMGMMFDFTLTANNTLSLKLERRYIDRNFVPGYFDKMYEIQRYQYSTDFPMMTKLQYLESLPSSGRYKGIYGEVSVLLLGTLEAWGTFQDNEDVPNDGRVELGIGFRELVGIKLAAQYTKSNIEDNDLNDIFTLDDRSLFLAYLSYQINSFMEVGTVFQRNWELDMGTGEYEPVDSYNVGVTFTKAF